MKKKDYRQKMLISLKYERKFPGSLDFFKKLLFNPETKISDFLLLYEFVFVYNRFFNWVTILSLEQILTKTEIESTNFTEFQKVFQRRRLLHPVTVVLEEEKNEMILSQQEQQEFGKASSFLSQIFLLLKSSPFGDSMKLADEQNRLLLENLEKSFFEALRSGDSRDLKKSVQRFDIEYNRFLVETIELWFSRTTIINSFFTAKKSLMSRFYLLLSLFFLDNKLELFLSSLEAFNNLSDDIRMKAHVFSEKDENAVENLRETLFFKELIEILKNVKLITWFNLYEKNKKNKKDE